MKFLHSLALVAFIVACNGFVIEKSKGCNFEGRWHKTGEIFAGLSCTGKCSCGDDGYVQCVDLCPTSRVICPNGVQPITVKRKSSIDSSCYCEEPACPSGCLYQGKWHKTGEMFIGLNCTAKCYCGDDGNYQCVGLCPRSFVTCPNGVKPIKVKRIASTDPLCYCEDPACPSDSGCHYKGRSYKSGEGFITPDCSGRCNCNKDGSVECVDLCPNIIPPNCPRGFKAITKKEKVSTNPLCYCTEYSCPLYLLYASYKK